MVLPTSSLLRYTLESSGTPPSWPQVHASREDKRDLEAWKRKGKEGKGVWGCSSEKISEQMDR